MGSFVIQAITHALLDLAANPEYLKPLREEVDELTKREGWTDSALEQMHRIDSFVKESQRLHPVGICELFLFFVRTAISINSDYFDFLSDDGQIRGC